MNLTTHVAAAARAYRFSATRFFNLRTLKLHSLSAVALLSGGILATGCGPAQSPKGTDAAHTKDIFVNDAQTRRNATRDEARWTVYLGGCTGSMLDATTLITANHCHPQPGKRYLSGASLARGGSYDMTVTRVLESDATYDYSIVQVAWDAGRPPAEQKFTPFISTKPADVKGGADSQATKLLTIGYPVDRGMAATYAQGFAKRYMKGWNAAWVLEYNIGTINGNSGGAVWRASDMMLVSLTNSGPHSFGQSGWSSNNPESQDSWNFGGAMYVIYSKSRVLQSIFQGGVNRNVDARGRLRAQ